jgi:hypothetical protein
MAWWLCRLTVTLVVIFGTCALVRGDEKPNIVFLLSDDQDVEIGGLVSFQF